MYQITTPDGIKHPVAGLDDEALASYSSSVNTIAALKAAIAAGDYAELPDPDNTPTPDYSQFRIKLLATPELTAWAEVIGFVAYTNLTQAAMADNWALTQYLYTSAAAANPPATGQIAAWEEIAEECNVEFEF